MYNKDMITLFVKKANNIMEKIIGLIGKDKPLNLMLQTHFGIHTFGLKFPIDVLILDDKNKVVSIKKTLKPNKIFLWNPMHKKVIEMPIGTVEKKKIKINDSIEVRLLP